MTPGYADRREAHIQSLREAQFCNMEAQKNLANCKNKFYDRLICLVDLVIPFVDEAIKEHRTKTTRR